MKFVTVQLFYFIDKARQILSFEIRTVQLFYFIYFICLMNLIRARLVKFVTVQSTSQPQINEWFSQALLINMRCEFSSLFFKSQYT